MNVTITDTSPGLGQPVVQREYPRRLGSQSAFVGFTGGTGGLTLDSRRPELDLSRRAQNIISTAKSESINDFVAPTSGWYYAEIGGNPGTNYSLVATRGADFALHGSSFAKAQPLNGADVVLGAIIRPTAPLYTLDDNLRLSYPI